MKDKCSIQRIIAEETNSRVGEPYVIKEEKFQGLK